MIFFVGFFLVGFKFHFFLFLAEKVYLYLLTVSIVFLFALSYDASSKHQTSRVLSRIALKLRAIKMDFVICCA